jgi:hypothetical protein
MMRYPDGEKQDHLRKSGSHHAVAARARFGAWLIAAGMSERLEITGEVRAETGDVMRADTTQ